jgi:peptidoglycan/xylan/chitin deacetylase (PgdA/CDA1 family)
MLREVPIPVLTYHGVNISGNTYTTNDHLALRDDLEMVTRMGWRVVPLPDLVADYLAGDWPEAQSIAITFDDGSDFDAVDLPHPVAGMQRSLLGIMRDFMHERPGVQPHLHATSFVIASREVLPILDKTCLIGKGWWNADWWAEALASGLLGIGNHSWDHLHVTLPHVMQRDQLKGDFHRVECFEDAETQVRAARESIRQTAANSADVLFAYPYGDVSDYLVREYFPRSLSSDDPPALAAFAAGDNPWTLASDRWCIPRWVCGDHWKTSADLEYRLKQLYA